MRRPRRIAVTILVVAVVAVAAAAANLALLRSTQDSTDPVGRLSPRAVFPAAGRSTVPDRPAAPVRPGGHELDD